jgi:hypothetical protein
VCNLDIKKTYRVGAGKVYSATGLNKMLSHISEFEKEDIRSGVFEGRAAPRLTKEAHILRPTLHETNLCYPSRVPFPRLGRARDDLSDPQRRYNMYVLFTCHHYIYSYMWAGFMHILVCCVCANSP